jgi:peptide/nickel transport system substrate-binding protein
MNDIGSLEALVKQGAISRRDFVKRAAALGVAVGLPLSMASGVAHATPKKGGKLRIGLGHGSTTDSLDPGTHENSFTSTLVNTYSGYLTEVDPSGQLIPEIAAAYETNTGAKVWRFKIREGVEFHNGKTLTPQDVVASLNFHRGEDSKSAGKGLLAAIEELKIDGDSVVFTLKDGNADFPYVMSDYHFPILPEKDGKLDWESGIGAGGYSIVNFEPGVRAQLKRHANYWKEGRAHFDEIELLSLLDTTARQNAGMNGDVDIIDRVDPKTVHLIQRVPTLAILEITGKLHYTFPMRLDQKPFDNYDLRMAVKYSIDREELVKKVLSGHGAVGNDHPISSNDRYYASDLAQRSYDPDKARAHLKKAGMEGATIELSTSEAAFAGAVDAALLIKSSAAKAGLTVNVKKEPKDGYWSNVWNKKAWCACYWGGRSTPDWMFTAGYVAESEWNDTAWRTGDAADKFNKLVKEARAEVDDAKRSQMYAECQELVRDDSGAVIPMFANYIHAHSKKLAHGTDVGANWPLDGARIAERWWWNS